MFRVAVVGGTFDHFHRGHEALVRFAFQSAREVRIGVTTTAYLRRHPKSLAQKIESFEKRRSTLERWILRTFPGRRWWTAPISSRLAGAVDPEVDLLVVTADTLTGAEAVNLVRNRRGIPPVTVRIVPTLLAEDDVPIRSSRIRQGTIDRNGKRLGRGRTRVSTSN